MPETDAAQARAQARTAADRSSAQKRRTAEHFDALAAARDRWKAKNAYYHRSIERLCRRFIPAGSRVLELGCGTGDTLAALSPDPRGSLGVDLSAALIARAREKHPALRFEVGDAENLQVPAAGFDFVVASDLVGHLPDILRTFRRLRAACRPETRLFLTYYNFAWEAVLQLAERIGQKMPQDYQNWLGMSDLENLLFLGGFRVAARGWEMLLPKRIPIVSDAVNAIAPRVPGLRHLCLVQYALAEPAPEPPAQIPAPSVSVVVPCRNESGNVDEAVDRIPAMGRATEVIFVDGQSTDGTVEKIERAIAERRGENEIRLIHQVPRGGSGPRGGEVDAEDPERMLRLGKGDAVRKGFAAAKGDVLMILDADLTVPPEDLPRFFDVIAEGKAEFVNGSRLVYPMEDESMRFANLLGNKAFSLLFTWLLGQPIKDTLCGTKVLRKSDYERIAANRAYFGDFDPFGDFDLLFGASRLGLSIVDLPIRYARRTSGVSKVRLVGHGLLLLRMCGIAFQKLKWNRWLGRDAGPGAAR